MVRVPKGVDPSFEHPKRLIPVHQVDKILMQKMTEADPKFAAIAVSHVLSHPPALALLNQSIKEMVDTVANEKIARGNLKYVGVIPQAVIVQLEAIGLAPQSAVIAIRDNDILHALRDSKTSKGLHLPNTFWQQLPEKLRQPDAILLQQDRKGAHNLLFVFKTDQGKVAIKLDYEVKLRHHTTGKKEVVKLNMVKTASTIISDVEWKDFAKSYQVLWGSVQ